MEITNETLEVTALEFRNVSVSFDEKLVLDRVSFMLKRGEMMFLTGESGSGKSVLLRLAIGLLRPDSGQIFVEGQEISCIDESELLTIRGRRMGIVFQSESLFSGMSVYDNAAYRLDEHELPEEDAEAKVFEVLTFVGLEKEAEKFPAELSGGMNRRLEIARALIGWPSIMLFDEPTLSLDPLTATQIMDLIIRARDIHGVTSIYVTKRLDEIPYLATHIGVLENSAVSIRETGPDTRYPGTKILVLESGRIAFSGSLAEFQASSLPAVKHLTAIETPPPTSFAPCDPWDKSRIPEEAVLSGD